MSSVYEIIEKARKTGKIEKGTNEVTKSVERGTAKLVVYAEDVQPKEIVQHLPILCREKGIPCITADSKQKLGAAAGILVATASIAIIDAGESAAKIAEFAKPLKEEKQKADAAEEEKPEPEERKVSETEKKVSDRGNQDVSYAPKISQDFRSEEKPKRTRKKKEE